jgi:hypothetical protein
MESGLMTDLTSIGTLFAFVIVSGGVLMLPKIAPADRLSGGGRFKLPYINGKYIVPVLYFVFVYFMYERIVSSAVNIGHEGLQEILFLMFVTLATVLTIFTVIRNYNIIPILGVLFCAYLLIEIPAVSWEYFLVWMAVGLVVYFSYGYWKSKLAE